MYLEYGIFSLIFAVVSFVIEKIYRGEKNYEKCLFWNGIGKFFRLLTFAFFMAHFFS
ncbi:hypothetical protein OAD03_00785 [Candidatus Pelagibacter sp.]|jgi:hypothetical protein|nr:hypothetical protein [Candidatus Pelagibacter sp.]|tara:strand:+ start:50 stop:220 length:171 start_codon:yes stop_codon:yes gene_type:complete